MRLGNIFILLFCIGIVFVLFLKENKNKIRQELTVQNYSGFIKIEGGTFKIGSPETELGRDSKSGKEQIRVVTVDSFYIAQNELTQKEYELYMGEHKNSIKGDNLPVDGVNWYSAVEFCNKISEKNNLQPVYTISKDVTDPFNQSPIDRYRYLVEWDKTANGYRLPTSEEWEIACRAGTLTPFNTGRNITIKQANFTGAYFPYKKPNRNAENGKIMPVGSFKPNAWGLYDMHGNVWEWCWDMYYYSENLTQPKFLQGFDRVIRGGAWYSDTNEVRSSYVGCTTADDDKSVGIRLARNAN